MPIVVPGSRLVDHRGKAINQVDGVEKDCVRLRSNRGFMRQKGIFSIVRECHGQGVETAEDFSLPRAFDDVFGD